MLQRYKEEKELRKLREQREKAKKGVFKVGLYRPTAPGFLSLVPEEPVIVKPREKVIRVILNLSMKNMKCMVLKCLFVYKIMSVTPNKQFVL